MGLVETTAHLGRGWRDRCGERQDVSAIGAGVPGGL